jgi:hypothetical protein
MPSQYYGSLGPNLNIKFEMNSTKGASANIAQEISASIAQDSLSYNILILYHIYIYIYNIIIL